MKTQQPTEQQHIDMLLKAYGKYNNFMVLDNKKDEKKILKAAAIAGYFVHKPTLEDIDIVLALQGYIAWLESFNFPKDIFDSESYDSYSDVTFYTLFDIANENEFYEELALDYMDVYSKAIKESIKETYQKVQKNDLPVGLTIQKIIEKTKNQEMAFCIIDEFPTPGFITNLNEAPIADSKEQQIIEQCHKVAKDQNIFVNDAMIKILLSQISDNDGVFDWVYELTHEFMEERQNELLETFPEVFL